MYIVLVCMSEYKKSPQKNPWGFTDVVEATGFEPTASASRTQRSTKLSHASTFIVSNLTLILYHRGELLSRPLIVK